MTLGGFFFYIAWRLAQWRLRPGCWFRIINGFLFLFYCSSFNADTVLFVFFTMFMCVWRRTHGGGLFFACENFGRMFDYSFPACALIFF